MIPPHTGTTALLPCPFCGGEPAELTAKGLRERVYCRACFSEGPTRKWRAEAVDATPEGFRDLLLSVARSAYELREAA